MRPDPKPGSRSEGRTRPRRTFRKKATRKEWAAIIAAKGGPCRICIAHGWVGHIQTGRIQYHHLVPRSQGGDDVADNITPLCEWCHMCVTANTPLRKILAANLTDAEYAYCVSKLGEGAIERLFGVGAAR